jgi:beta-1,4-mannosyltransferase
VRKISFYLYAITRVILQICQILYLLAYKYRNLEFVLVQNPPSIPNLFAIWLASKVNRFKMVIDFHNYGYTILELGIKNRIIVNFAKFYEKYFAKKASLFFCVSDKMGQDLK